MYKIYKYTNDKNGKVYIGQTSTSLESRAGANGRNYSQCPRFYNAIKKYGWESFRPEILLDNLSREDANNAEVFFINQYKSQDDKFGYNIADGGQSGVTTEDARKVISEKAKERYKDPKNNPMYGKTHSESALKKMREKKIGKANPMYGVHLSDEHKKKISDSQKGRVGCGFEWTDEMREAARVRQKERAKELKRRVICIDDNVVFDSITEAAKAYSVSKGTMSSHLHGKQKTCRGKHFKFA